MDVKAFYDAIGGDYETALSRLMNDTLIEKYVKKFADTQKIDKLKEYVESGDLENVFFEAHTLKGVSANLSFKVLSEISSTLTELVRGDNKLSADLKKVENFYSQIEQEYNKIITLLKNAQ